MCQFSVGDMYEGLHSCERECFQYRVPPVLFLNVCLLLDKDCSFSLSYVILDGTRISEDAKCVR